jgi:hypothetical protein
MSDEMFDFTEKPTGCPQCGRATPEGVCLWCHPLNTKPKVIARRGGPATSKAAAAGIAYRTGSQKARILALYGQAQEDGLTDEEVASFLGWVEVNKARKRCSDLRNEGMIEPVDGGSVTRVGKSGMANLVCAITDRGIATLASMKEPHARQPVPVPVPSSASDPAHTHRYVWGGDDRGDLNYCECGATDGSRR